MCVQEWLCPSVETVVVTLQNSSVFHSTGFANWTKARNFVHGGGLTDRDLKLDSGLLNLIQVPRRPDLVTACMTERGTGNGRQQTHVRPMPRKVAG